MSGGVDSAVAAALMAEEGHDVTGVTLKLWCYGKGPASPRACCTLDAIDDARRVAERMGFPHFVVDAEQVATLVAELKREAGRPLLVAVDQEGGRVARLRAPQGFTELPPMRALGEAGDEALAREVGRLLGRELRAVGIDQDYAPVVDVDTNPANPVIGDRALSRDPAVVAAYRADPLVHGRASLGLARDSLVATAEVEAAATLGAPVLVVHGGADRIALVEGSRALAARHRGGVTLREHAGLFHEPHNEPERELVLDEIAAWLGQRAAAWGRRPG